MHVSIEARNVAATFFVSRLYGNILGETDLLCATIYFRFTKIKEFT